MEHNNVVVLATWWIYCQSQRIAVFYLCGFRVYLTQAL